LKKLEDIRVEMVKSVLIPDRYERSKKNLLERAEQIKAMGSLAKEIAKKDGIAGSPYGETWRKAVDQAALDDLHHPPFTFNRLQSIGDSVQVVVYADQYLVSKAKQSIHSIQETLKKYGMPTTLCEAWEKTLEQRKQNVLQAATKDTYDESILDGLRNIATDLQQRKEWLDKFHEMESTVESTANDRSRSWRGQLENNYRNTYQEIFGKSYQEIYKEKWEPVLWEGKRKSLQMLTFDAKNVNFEDTLQLVDLEQLARQVRQVNDRDLEFTRFA